ncbi:putative quinol monooxygenase [Alloalcanivorax mobilis]|uniref:putative quinol monooxygenase n=1 Tax=Alloalcanivorax mobilis TaxID=2019569 RepID=UPI000B5B25BF|nr:putative quinol monooxygenase [Alloalcanivorax mobilis]ASK33876.1 antibiotic biosynthesis monooxygenase [Alcanivorax sp. N3-2A]|tara:strand:+ start:53667 stop:53948 length:282 start_codon:yes stop_codon:yes gene_type:complete
MIGITAILKASPGSGDALAQEMKNIAAEVVKEEGNHAYKVHQSLEDRDTVMIYEQYSDQAALDAHRENMKSLGGGLKGLLAGRPDVKLFNLLD